VAPTKHSGELPIFRAKKAAEMEQKAVVAAPSQSRTINAPALPRSNQIEATVFD
jgi:hypothetical protein